MAAKKGGLGRGLEALFEDNATENGGEVNTVSIGDIEPDRGQPRKYFDQEALAELAHSIAQHGVIQPILVRPKVSGGYTIVAGERRWRAARIAGLAQIPVIVREMADKDAAEIALIENLQREDLNFYDEAVGIDRLIKSHGLTQEEAAHRLGKSQSSVANKLRVLRIPEEQLQRLAEEGFTERHARALVMVADDKKRGQLIDKIIKSRLTVAQTEELVARSTALQRKRPVKVCALKDMRIYLNTLAKALNSIRSSGLDATSTKRETEKFIEYTILIPKNSDPQSRIPLKIG